MTTMRPIRDTIPVEEAKALLLEAAAPVERIERVALGEASGRVLATPVLSAIDVPPFDRAAMDGYAVIAEDTFGAGRYEPRVLRCVEKLYTGALATRTLAPGECIEIATGAPLPGVADAVVMVEETERANDTDVRVFTPVYPRQHVGRRGADMTADVKSTPAPQCGWSLEDRRLIDRQICGHGRAAGRHDTHRNKARRNNTRCNTGTLKP